MLNNCHKVNIFSRTIIYLVNSGAETTVRFSNLILVQQFISILIISTTASFALVVAFEAPIVHMEKLLFGMGRKEKQKS